MNDSPLKPEDLSKRMELFFLNGRIDKHYSNVVPLFDVIDKYCYGRSKKTTIEDSTQSFTTRFKYQKASIEMDVSITAANITSYRDKKNYLVFPGEREELVESVLKKFAAEGGGRFVDDDAAVVFSLYKLKKELSDLGHKYSLQEIKEALITLRRATLSITPTGTDDVIESGFIQSLGLVNRESYRKDNSQMCYVKFHPLVSRSIIDAKYRRHNYITSVQKIRISLARHIAKRLDCVYTNASETGLGSRYDIMLSTIMDNNPRRTSNNRSRQKQTMTAALEELKDKQVIKDYIRTDKKDGRKLIDVKFTLYPHPKFIKQQRSGNSIVKRVEEQLGLNLALKQVDINDEIAFD